jgi:hypothetical protein
MGRGNSVGHISIGACESQGLDWPVLWMCSDVVLAKKQPRKVFVQPNTFVVDGKVELKEYPLTNEGVIQSFVERQLWSLCPEPIKWMLVF